MDKHLLAIVVIIIFSILIILYIKISNKIAKNNLSDHKSEGEDCLRTLSHLKSDLSPSDFILLE